MSDSIAALRARTTQELIAAHDAKAIHTFVGVNYYLEELARRENAQIAQRSLDLTKPIGTLTWVITLLTALNVIAACASTYAVLRG